MQFGLAEYERWTPKWRWFKPPLWGIFKWAYRIDHAVFQCMLKNNGKRYKARPLTPKKPHFKIKQGIYKFNINETTSCTTTNTSDKNKEDENVSISESASKSIQRTTECGSDEQGV